MLIWVVLGITLAEPSFAGEIFGWAKNFSRQSLSAIQETGSHGATSAWFLAICCALFTLYYWILRRVEGIVCPRVQAVIFLAGAFFLMIQLIAPVMLSTDAFAYAIYGRVLSVYHENPYDAAPAGVAIDPFMPHFGQQYLPSWYGPLWTLISAGITWFGGEHVGLIILLFRSFAVISALFCALFIWLILRKTKPQCAAQGLVFFLWNPLLVMETGLSAHNDCTMLAIALLGFWLHLRGAKVAALVALTLSALIKFFTGMLIPLYVVLVLREAKDWRERISFLTRGGLATILIAGGAMVFSRSDSGVPAGHAAFAPDFYRNNFHELIFKGLRLSLGEDAKSFRTSIYFQGWWITPNQEAPLSASADKNSPVIAHLNHNDKLIVVAPQEGDWARVYDPALKKFGFVDTALFSETIYTAADKSDAVVQKYEHMAMDWPTVQTANRWIRFVTWLSLALFGLWCVWRTTSFDEFLVWSAAALIAACYSIITEIWPWYVNWGVGLGALAPHRLPARLVIFLSPAVLTLYVTLGYLGSEPYWIGEYRSLIAFVLPVTLFFVSLRINRRGPAVCSAS